MKKWAVLLAISIVTLIATISIEVYHWFRFPHIATGFEYTLIVIIALFGVFMSLWGALATAMDSRYDEPINKFPFWWR